jgi:hypothetical protein
MTPADTPPEHQPRIAEDETQPVEPIAAEQEQLLRRQKREHMRERIRRILEPVWQEEEERRRLQQ